MDDQVDALHMQTARRNVGRHHGADLTGSERREVPAALALGQVAVKLHRRRPGQGREGSLRARCRVLVEVDTRASPLARAATTATTPRT